MWELDHKASWVPKNWWFWTVMLQKTLESPLEEIQPVNPKGNQSWIFTGRTDTETEAPILWPLDVKNWLTERDPNAGKDWRQEEKGMTEDEMIRWHHRHDGHEFDQAPGVGQGSLVCCSPSGRKESNMTEWLNWLKDLFHQFPWSTECLTLHPEFASGSVEGQQLQWHRQMANALVVVVQWLVNALGKCQLVVDTGKQRRDMRDVWGKLGTCPFFLFFYYVFYKWVKTQFSLSLISRGRCQNHSKQKEPASSTCLAWSNNSWVIFCVSFCFVLSEGLSPHPMKVLVN